MRQKPREEDETCLLLLLLLPLLHGPSELGSSRCLRRFRSFPILKPTARSRPLQTTKVTMDATTCLPVILVLLAALLHQAPAVFPINKKYDDSNPEGVPGVDYPIYRSVPRGLPFSCYSRKPGFYADPDTDCQVWHICDLHGRRYSFLCANKTVFNQYNRGCDWWYNVNCDASEDLYSNNDDVFKSNRLGNNHPNFISRPNIVPPHRVNLDSPPSNRVDIPREGQPPVRVVTAAPPPPPTLGPAVPARTKTPRPLVPLDIGRPATFKVIRRPVTTTSAPFDAKDEFARPVRPRPALGPFRPPPPPPPPPAQTDFLPEASFAPAEQPFTEGPPSSWTVHFVAGNVKPNGQPPYDQSWRLAPDQERAFPTRLPVATEPPNDIDTFPTTRRAAHGLSTIPPVDQQFIPPRRTRLPPLPTQRNTEPENDFQTEPSTSHHLPNDRFSTSVPFGSRSSPNWDTSSVESVSFPDNNGVNVPLQNDNSFIPETPEETLINEFQASQGSFGERGSQTFEITDDNVQHPSTQRPFHSSPVASAIPSRISTNNFFVSSTNPPFPTHSELWRSSPQDNPSPSIIGDNWWSTPEPEVQNDNLLPQTDQSVFIPPEVPAEVPSNSFSTQEEINTTKRPAKITTYHPQRIVPEVSSPPSNQISDDFSSTQHPVVRTTRRRIIKTTTIPSTTTTTTTVAPPPVPRSKAVSFNDDASIAEEPSIPLVFGTRLKPKKTFRVDNDASSSNLDPATVVSENEEPEPAGKEPYDLPVVLDDILEPQHQNQDSLPIN